MRACMRATEEEKHQCKLQESDISKKANRRRGEKRARLYAGRRFLAVLTHADPKSGGGNKTLTNKNRNA